MGVELDRPKGKNDGSVQGTRYFSCKPLYGLFTKAENLLVLQGKLWTSRGVRSTKEALS